MKTTIKALFVAILTLLTTLAITADYPTKTIRVVVPFEPGGAGDITSRIITEAANSILTETKMRVVNRSGGGGIVGQTFVSRSAPDGYTILSMTNSVITNPTLKGASYTADDFRLIALYNFDPEVIAVAADSPYESTADLIAAAKASKPNMVTAGVATAHHMAGLAIEQATDVRFNYLPIRGFGNQLQAVLGQHADGGFWPLGEAASHVRGGTIRILAIAAETRDERFPDVPTFTEAGLGVPVWATFRGWAVPVGTPDNVTDFLENLLRRVHEQPDYRQKMEAAGYRPVYRGQRDFEAVVDDYDKLTRNVIDAHGLGQ